MARCGASKVMRARIPGSASTVAGAGSCLWRIFTSARSGAAGSAIEIQFTSFDFKCASAQGFIFADDDVVVLCIDRQTYTGFPAAKPSPLR